MNWDAIGALGEVIGAIAVVVTLIYLAAQIKQNTHALKSSTFQDISSTLAKNGEVIATTPGLPELFLKAEKGLSALSPEEQVKFSAFCLMTHRRIESIYVQESLGALDPILSSGFKRSILSAYGNQGYREWWERSAYSFSDEFADWINTEIEKGVRSPTNLSMGASKNAPDT